jgi:tRNA (mo5U34)-methyltransferase
MSGEPDDREWYHTIELAPGVVTPGWFDTRRVAAKLPFPPLRRLRCLDVATADGFWAFEMERRGAGEVLAIDVLDPRAWDWPGQPEKGVLEALGRRKGEGRGFETARQALGSRVEFAERSVYDLDPTQVGEFDFVYLGSLLLHLRDPVRALERVHSVCRGRLLLVENVDLTLTVLARRAVASFDGRGRPWWWRPNVAALVRMLRAARFEPERPPMRFYMPPGAGHPTRRQALQPQALRTADGRHIALTALKGDPHAAILARPVGRRPTR